MRKQEEQINQEKFTFEKEVLEKAEKAANLDRDMLSRHQQRLSEFEKHLLAKFNLVLEEYRSRVANDVEFHFSKRRQVTFFLCNQIIIICRLLTVLWMMKLSTWIRSKKRTRNSIHMCRKRLTGSVAKLHIWVCIAMFECT